jgi:hypothetical protein
MSINRLSRRDFLKLTGLGIAELAFGPLNKALDWIGSSGEAGNLAQRAAKLETLTRQVIKEPSELNQELLGSLLKFNAAELELQHQGQPLAAELMTTFLYGDGSPKDISTQYESAITQAAIFPYHIYGPHTYPESLKNRFDIDQKSFFSEQSLSTYFSTMFLDAFMANHMSTENKSLGRVKVNLPKDRYREAIDANGKISFTQTIASPDGDNDAIFNALHNYTITVTGDVLSKRRVKSPQDLTGEDVNINNFAAIDDQPKKWLKAYYPHTRLQLDNPRLQVYDLYDFSHNPDFMNKLGHTASAADAFKFIADTLVGPDKSTEYWSQLPKSVRDYLWNLNLVELQHHKAATLLTDHGVAHPFPVTANLELHSPLVVPLFDRDLDFEP